MTGRTKGLLTELFFRFYKAATRLGVHVLPVHYYSSVPNLVELESSRPVWARKSELPGIPVDLDAQVARLRDICSPYQEEYLGNTAYLDAVARNYGQGFGFIEAQALHGVLRYYQPSRIIEVGSGVSTYCMSKALELNERESGKPATLTCIEPYPSAPLRDMARGGVVELVEEQVQALPPAYFEKLSTGDVLFIDSSHTVKPGSDVNYLILEVLPRLRSGVVVQLHDIYLPYDYQRNVLSSFLHWQETSLLRAFLIGNEDVEIVFCLSQLHYDRQAALREVFPEYEPQPDADGMAVAGSAGGKGHFPASIYLQIR